jgi:hypothetical protein
MITSVLPMIILVRKEKRYMARAMYPIRKETFFFQKI